MVTQRLRSRIQEPPAVDPFVFGQIVCAVDGSIGAQEAVRQAVSLVSSVDTLLFVAVTDALGPEPATGATLSERHANDAVESARATAAAEGVSAVVAVVHAPDIGEAILEAARDAGLLVLGTHGHSHHAGDLLGSTAVRALHACAAPVLVARSRPELGFPGVILVGSRGADDHHAVVTAAGIAARHGARVVLAHAGPSGPLLAQALADQAADVREITGWDPVIVTVDGAPADRLPAMATSTGAGLVVLGSRGPLALSSVSALVAHRSACSVLVVRPDLSPPTRSTQ